MFLFIYFLFIGIYRFSGGLRMRGSIDEANWWSLHCRHEGGKVAVGHGRLDGRWPCNGDGVLVAASRVATGEVRKALHLASVSSARVGQSVGDPSYSSGYWCLMGPSCGIVSYWEKAWNPRIPQLAMRMSAPKQRIKGPARRKKMNEHTNPTAGHFGLVSLPISRGTLEPM